MKTYRIFAVALAMACSTPTEPASNTASFIIEVSGESFRVEVTTAQQAQALRARLASGTRGVISGDLVQGSGGFNTPWRWHMNPATVHVADMAIELCDGRPSMVEADLTYWLGSVRRFCPWGAKVVSEE
ncbi:MAG: hypothetical protein JNL26_13675 [Gemmatimonadetes bacterium]|nr:hypothetical protein [Gemmatimonadota bacterium]